MIARALWLTLLVGLVSAPAQAREATASPGAFERPCRDDYGTDRCDAETQRKMRALYGWRSAEELLAEGTTFRRVMFVNGYGIDVVAISFERAPGKAPLVRIETPPHGETPAPLVASMRAEDWATVIRQSADFDAQLAREIETGEPQPDSINVCLHGWFVVAEAGDAPRLSPNVVGQAMQPAKLRSDTEGACADGLAMPFAFELARLAYELLPECSSVPKARVRNIPQLLAYCHRLGGDRLAAGDAMRFTSKLEHALRSARLKSMRRHFADGAADSARDFKKLVESGRLDLGLPSAADVDHARVKGTISRYLDEEHTRSEVADVMLELVRETGQFVILTYDVSAFRPAEEL